MTNLGINSPAGARRVAAAVVALSIIAACGGANDAVPAADRSAPTSGPPSTGESSVQSDADPLEGEVTAILEAAMEPGAIDWTNYGVAGDPTAVTAGVRMEGRDDLLLVVGSQVDGSEATSSDPLFVSVAIALVQTVALQLVDEGALDLAATVDAWAPDMPAADVTTVESLIEMTTGWSKFGEPGDTAVLDDLERRWTLSEVVAIISPSVSVDPHPSVATTNDLTTSIVLGHVLEQVTGTSLADLVDARVAGPLGLDDTAISDGPIADDHRHGIFDWEGKVVDTSMFPLTAYLTWHAATFSGVSSVPDLLDLLDAWQSGALFRTDRTPGVDRFSPERATTAVDPVSYEGLGVPFNGYCPCTPSGAGHDVTAIGRAPSAHRPGVDTHAIRYADGITVVVSFNSGQATDRTQTKAVVDAIHAAARKSA